MSGLFVGGYYCYHCLIAFVFGLNLIAFTPVQDGARPITSAEQATGFFQISPDSQHVVYAANEALGGGFLQLYSAPLSGGASVQLNLSLPDERIFNYAISADSRRVVYQMGTDLYSVPIVGPSTASVKINQVELMGDVQHQFSLSPDGRFVVYRTKDDLYSVPLAGPAEASIKLNLASPLAPESGLAGVNVADFAVSPDSQHVVYVAQTGLSAFSLYRTPMGGPAAASVQLSSSMPGADVDQFTISSDSQYIAYLSDQEVDARFELYSVPLAGSVDMSVRLNVPLMEGESVYAFTLSADATRVVYAKGYELYSTPIAGPHDAGVRLNAQLATLRIDDFEISADSQWVVFQSGDLYSAPLNGPAIAIVQLTDMVAGGRGVGQFSISPDSQHVVYSGYETPSSPLELFSIPIQGPIEASVKLNRPLATAEQPLSFQVTADGQSVIYAAYQDDAQKNELYGVPVTGTASEAVKLNSEVEWPGVHPIHWQISNNSRWLIYAVDSHLYVVDLDEQLDWVIANEGTQGFEPRYIYLPIMPRQVEN